MTFITDQRSITASLFSKELAPTPAVINHIMSCLGDSPNFNDALYIVVDELAKANMFLDPYLLNHLIGLPGETRCDWELKKSLCRQMPAPLLNETLIQGIFFASVQNKDARAVHEFFSIAQKRELATERVQNTYMRSLIQLNQTKAAVAEFRREINAKRVTDYICVGFLSALPANENQVFEKIYSLARNRGILTPKSLKKFIPLLSLAKQERELWCPDNDEVITPFMVNRVLTNHIKAGAFDKAEEIFYIAKERNLLDNITWNQIIDLEYRLRDRFETAMQLFLESPIEVISRAHTEVPTLDLHGFSYGCAVFVLNSFIKAKANETKLLVITGKGTSEDGNFLAMQNYIAEFILTHFPKIRITKSENPGILTLVR